MSEPLRIFLRWLGLALLLASLACLVLLVEPGPREVARWMGESCTYDKGRTSEQCSVIDAASFLWAFAGAFLLIGFILRMWTRPDDMETRTLDLSRFRRGR